MNNSEDEDHVARALALRYSMIAREKAEAAYQRALQRGLHHWEAQDIFEDVYRQELLRRHHHSL